MNKTTFICALLMIANSVYASRTAQKNTVQNAPTQSVQLVAQRDDAMSNLDMYRILEEKLDEDAKEQKQSFWTTERIIIGVIALSIAAKLAWDCYQNKQMEIVRLSQEVDKQKEQLVKAVEDARNDPNSSAAWNRVGYDAWNYVCNGARRLMKYPPLDNNSKPV